MAEIITDIQQAQRSRRIGWLLLLVVLAINVIFMPREIWPSDPWAWRLEARSLLHYGRLWIDPDKIFGEPGQYFTLNPVDGHWYSKYGLANMLISLVPEKIQMHVEVYTRQPSVLVYNLWNIAISLLLAATLYKIAERYAAEPWRRFAYVMACMFATFLWYYQRAQGSEIYQTLFFCLAYECILRGLTRPRWVLMAWLFIGLLVLGRIFFGILMPVYVLFGLVMIARGQSPRKILPALILPPMVILLLLGWINNLKFGSPWLTGYHQWKPEDHLLTGSWMDGIYGLLFSGHWSIFTYFPVLIIALPGMRKFAADHRTDFALILATFLVTLLVLAKIPTWRGEWSYGPRYVLFLLPILSLPALSLEFGRPRVWWIIAGAGLAFSIWLQVEVNSCDFWFFYQIQQPLDKMMDKEIAQYFYDHPEGIIIRDLSSHRNDLDDSFLIRHLRDRIPPQNVERYRKVLIQYLDFTNLYWWESRDGP
jgi:hypothetical protein